MNNDFKYTNGTRVRDKITGFSGTITGRADYITGCNNYLVQPQNDKDDKYVDSHWFDEMRLELVEKAESFIQKLKRKTGADKPAPSK